jgi:hypothetical protein
VIGLFRRLSRVGVRKVLASILNAMLLLIFCAILFGAPLALLITRMITFFDDGPAPLERP